MASHNTASAKDEEDQQKRRLRLDVGVHGHQLPEPRAYGAEYKPRNFRITAEILNSALPTTAQHANRQWPATMQQSGIPFNVELVSRCGCKTARKVADDSQKKTNG